METLDDELASAMYALNRAKDRKVDTASDLYWYITNLRDQVVQLRIDQDPSLKGVL